MTNRRPSLVRRRILAGIAGTATLLAGCSAAPGDDSTYDLAVAVTNRLPEIRSVTILVVSGEGETIETAEYDLRPDASRTHRIDDVPAGTYRIVVDSDRWRTTATWGTETCDQFLAETLVEEGADGTLHTPLSVECPEERLAVRS